MLGKPKLHEKKRKELKVNLQEGQVTQQNQAKNDIRNFQKIAKGRSGILLFLLPIGIFKIVSCRAFVKLFLLPELSTQILMGMYLFRGRNSSC